MASTCSDLFAQRTLYRPPTIITPPKILLGKKMDFQVNNRKPSSLLQEKWGKKQVSRRTNPPSQGNCFSEKQRQNYCDKQSYWHCHGQENRSALVDHPYLHIICNSRNKYALHDVFSSFKQASITFILLVVLYQPMVFWKKSQSNIEK